MKKTLLTLIFLSILTVSTFAGDPPENDPNCNYGHINSPIYQCQPPPSSRTVETGNGSTDDSTFGYLESIVAEYNPLAYFLK